MRSEEDFPGRIIMRNVTQLFNDLGPEAADAAEVRRWLIQRLAERAAQILRDAETT